MPQVRTQTDPHPPARRARRARWSRCTAPAARSPTATASRSSNVWVTLPDSGPFASTDADGRFRFDRLTPGRHRLLARTADGREASADLEVPGSLLDLVLDGGKAAAGGRKSGKRG